MRALLLDGGGSTTMAVRGRVTNRPSDRTGERPVSTALLVHAGADTGRPDPWRGAASADATAAVWEREAADAGSTGGWARSVRGTGGRLPAGLDAALR